MSSEEILWLVLGVGLAGAALALMWLRGRIGEQEAKAALRNGAILVDVRTEEEYASGHLPRSINVPLRQLDDQMEKRVPVKDALVLCHCASGMRSAAATRRLRRMGYTRVFNLGSYQRAERVTRR